jgi:hypothetical protein
MLRHVSAIRNVKINCSAFIFTLVWFALPTTHSWVVCGTSFPASLTGRLHASPKISNSAFSFSNHGFKTSISDFSLRPKCFDRVSLLSLQAQERSLQTMDDISEGLVAKVLSKAETLNQGRQHWIAVRKNNNYNTDCIYILIRYSDPLRMYLLESQTSPNKCMKTNPPCYVYLSSTSLLHINTVTVLVHVYIPPPSRSMRALPMWPPAS